MKLIFLDIDGVLNMYGDSSRTFMKPYGQHIEPHLVQRLNYIVEKTKCKIVISSSWRSHMEDLKIQLEEQGFKYWSQIIGKTIQPQIIDNTLPYPRDKTNFLYSDRGEQINEWLDTATFRIEKYIVIDDERSDIELHIPKENIVQTDYAEGMLDKDAKEIVKRLNS